MNAHNEEHREPTIFNSRLILAFVAVTLFIALVSRQNDLALLAILVLLLMGGVRIWTAFSSVRVRCDGRVDSRRVFPGESLRLATALENGKWLPIAVTIRWPFEGGLKPAGEGGPAVQRVVSLLWHQIASFQHEFVALQRGVYRLGPPRIWTSDLLGFFRKAISTNDATSVVVYPRLVPIRPVAIRRKDFFEVPGAKSPVQDPVYILGTRDYQAFRPSRHIHWKASARHQRLQEKIFEPSEQAKVLLGIDASSFQGSDGQEAFERTLEVAASLAVNLDKMGCAVGLATNGLLTGGGSGAIPIGCGSRQIAAILETLAKIKTSQKETMQQAIEHALGSLRGVSCVQFCHADGPLVTDMERFLHKLKIPVTFLVCRRKLTSQPMRDKNDTLFYAIDEIHLDRNLRL
jgi:uncharacterized protein (DUF58 family)